MSLARTFLAISISIVLALFIGYGLYVLYPTPTQNYTEYQAEYTACQTKYDCYSLTDKCTLLEGNAEQSCRSQVLNSAEYKQCQTDEDACQKDAQDKREAARNTHDRNAFYILIAISIICLLLGFLLSKLQGIGSGLIGAGVLTVIYSLFSTWNYWMNFNKYVKLGALAVVLIILIYFGYTKLEKKFKNTDEVEID